VIACAFEKLAYNQVNIKKRADALTNLPPGKVDRESGCGSNQSNQPGDASALYTLEGFFMCESKIALEKIRAYRATDYRLGHIDKDIVLAVGLRSCQLAQLFATKGVNCGAFLTAYNPRGSQQTDSQNELAHAKLAAKLKIHNVEAIEGSGSEEGTDWPSEKSYFALGLKRDDSIEIGRHFDQDAIVWVCENAVPELILLR